MRSTVKARDSSKYKNWMRYANYLRTGQWHIHTNYTDGDNSVDDCCRQAIASKIPLVVFSEHVRRNLDYDFSALQSEIELARRKYTRLIILSGCEAKVLETGELDVSQEVLTLSEIVLMAFHSFPTDGHLYYQALKVALTNPKVDIWAHPGLFLVRNNITLRTEYLEKISGIAAENNVLVELNTRHNMPSKQWMPILKDKVTFVRGDDIHSLEDFKRASQNELWSLSAGKTDT
jgi:DNA polymerase (family 10)/putative hydrolase